MYGVTEELWFPEWEFKAVPWDKPELYEKWSPHLYAKNFKTPTLVVHGELDYRVPIGEGCSCSRPCSDAACLRSFCTSRTKATGC